MYVKEERSDYIFYFISGYCSALVSDKDSDVNKKFNLWFLKWLEQWMTDNDIENNIPNTLFWYDYIRCLTKDGKSELKVFFDLVNLFFEDYNNKRGYFEWLKEEDEIFDN